MKRVFGIASLLGLSDVSVDFENSSNVLGWLLLDIRNGICKPFSVQDLVPWSLNGVTVPIVKHMSFNLGLGRKFVGFMLKQ